MHSYTQISGLVAPSPVYFKDAPRVELLGPEHGEGQDSFPGCESTRKAEATIDRPNKGDETPETTG